MSDEHERFLTTGQYRRMVTTSRLRKGLPAPPSEVWDKRDKLPLAALKEDDLLEQLEERRNGQEQGAVPIKPIVADDD
jgi:hypothetical protein